MLKCSDIFGNDMVLQRDKQIPIWGAAEPGAQVHLTMQGQTFSATADEDGRWKAVWGPFHTSTEETLIVSSGGEKLTFTGVQIGEVWLAGGQSNMEFHMRYDADYDQEFTGCENPSIRFFDYPEVSYLGQIDERDYRKQYAFWRRCDPANLERFSAVGYYFAKEIQQRYGVPVGIVGCNWGGTVAAAWMDEDSIRKGGGQVYLDEYAQATANLDLEEYDRRFRANTGSYHVDLLDDPIGDMFMRGDSIQQIAEKLRSMGITLTEQDQLPPIGPKYERRPCGLYHSMLAQVAPYGLRGILYYQGESDGDAHPDTYFTLFPALIENWRRLWGEELPFLFAQIAPLRQWMQCNGAPYAIIRQAQQHAADTIPLTGMASTSDVGMEFDIHPKKKQPVGCRLALLAENIAYGEEVPCQAPRLQSGELRNGALTLRFENAYKGLELRTQLPSGIQADPCKLSGLQLFQNGQPVSTENVTASAKGGTVVLTGLPLKDTAGLEVRFACTGWYAVNLYNSAGISAVPATILV